MLRRLTWAGALACVVAFGVSAGATSDHYPTPAGTWTMKVDFNFILDPANPDVTIPFQLSNLQNFTLDGRTTLLLPTGIGHPNAGDPRIGCMGEWRIRPGQGPREFDLALKCKYDQNWDSPYGEIRGIMRLSKDGRTLVAEFSYIDHNGDGTLLRDQGRGVMYGTRYELLPLP